MTLRRMKIRRGYWFVNIRTGTAREVSVAGGDVIPREARFRSRQRAAPGQDMTYFSSKCICINNSRRFLNICATYDLCELSRNIKI